MNKPSWIIEHTKELLNFDSITQPSTFSGHFVLCNSYHLSLVWIAFGTLCWYFPPQYLHCLLMTLHFSGRIYNRASKRYCIIYLTCSTCSSSILQYINTLSNYADRRLSNVSLIALLIYPWKLVGAFIVPSCIAVGFIRPYLVCKGNLY